jgi:hypothetical protein
MGSLKWRDTAGATIKIPMEELKELKYQGRDLEGQEVANRNNSGDKLKTYREPAIMALDCRQSDNVEGVEGASPNEEGGDYFLERPAELGYPVTKPKWTNINSLFKLLEWKMNTDYVFEPLKKKGLPQKTLKHCSSKQ